MQQEEIVNIVSWWSEAHQKVTKVDTPSSSDRPARGIRLLCVISSAADADVQVQLCHLNPGLKDFAGKAGGALQGWRLALLLLLGNISINADRPSAARHSAIIARAIKGFVTSHCCHVIAFKTVCSLMTGAK